jgi:hypothetical protein
MRGTRGIETSCWAASVPVVSEGGGLQSGGGVRSLGRLESPWIISALCGRPSTLL